MEKAEARRQLGSVVSPYTTDRSGPDDAEAAVRKTDDPAEDDALAPVALERELIAFTRAQFTGEQVPFFSRLDFQFSPGFDRKKFDDEFRAIWINGTEETGILQWVPFSCISRFTDSLADHDWSESGVLSNLWNRWLQERLLNWGLVDEEIDDQVRKCLADHELAPDAAAVQAEVARVRQQYIVLKRSKESRP